MIDIQKTDWTDPVRDRVVPVKIYSPQDEAGPFPMIIFSHGLGSSRDVYGYLGRHWASHGYVSVHVQHAGTDSAVWEKAPVSQRMQLLQRAASLPENFKNRPKDISFAIDTLTKLNEADSKWKNRLDMNRVGVAGHSFGAFTALASVGEIFFYTARRTGFLLRSTHQSRHCDESSGFCKRRTARRRLHAN